LRWRSAATHGHWFRSSKRFSTSAGWPGYSLRCSATRPRQSI
jgi:hypothetical protein